MSNLHIRFKDIPVNEISNIYDGDIGKVGEECNRTVKSEDLQQGICRNQRSLTMRKREKQRIFKRFMDGESVLKIAYSIKAKDKNWYVNQYSSFKLSNLVRDIENSIRECVWDEIKKGDKK